MKPTKEVRRPVLRITLQSKQEPCQYVDLIGCSTIYHKEHEVMMPQLSVLIPWCNREEIRTTLQHNLPILGGLSAEVLLLNCGGKVEQLRALTAGSVNAELHVVDLLRRKFNKSYALNIGAYLSRSAKLFVLDADILLNRENLRQIPDLLERPIFVTIEKVVESDRSQISFEEICSGSRPLSIVRTNVIDIALADGSNLTIRSFRSNDVDGSRAGPGLIFVSKNYLISVGGYNSHLQSWGWEDNDFRLRLGRVLDLEHRELGSGTHLSHSNDRRALFGNSPESANKANFLECCKQYAVGNFRGTYEEDVRLWLSNQEHS
jgi:glycosyltransferase involved in cell wall biosynthesis